MGSIEYLIVVLVVILLSMTLHEAMHAFAGYALGDDTARAQGRLTLNPLKHIDPFMTIILPLMLAILGGPVFGGAKPVPFNPLQVRYGEWGAALVALAGPLTNLFIAFIVFGIGVFTGVIGEGGLVQATFAGQCMMVAIMVNLGFFAFNILPIPPLDGSRVLYTVAPEVVRRGMDQIERYGVFLVFVLVLAGSSLIGGVLLTIISAVLSGFRAVFGV